MSASHTPGPWHVEGRYVFPRGYQSNPICGISGYLGQDPAQISANASLIAAAPELLEALQGLVNCNLDHPGGSCDHYERATAAIARVTGAPTP